MKYVLIATILLICPFVSLNTSGQISKSSENETHNYIVLFNNNETQSIEINLAKTVIKQKLSNSKYRRDSNKSVDFKKTYQQAVSGVLLAMSEEEAKSLTELEFVQLVERDSLAYPDWGLDRINQVNLPLDNNELRSFNGLGSNIYIIDTGINQAHDEFSGRLGDVVSMVSGGTADCDGHGTHVASVAAGTSYGVANEATIHSVRISNICSGSATANASDIVDAFEWVRANAEHRSVVNYSFTSGSSAIRTAMDNVIKAGHVIVTSAGNDDIEACNANAYKSKGALIVGSTTRSDSRSSFSNYGTCISLFAPGSSIIGASHLSNTGSIVLSGTSMASPIIAGIAATYRGRFPTASAYEVMEAIVDGATSGVVSDANGSPNKLAYTDVDLPSAYWQATWTISSPGPLGSQLPSPGCSMGDVHIVTLGQTSPTTWMNLRYECM